MGMLTTNFRVCWPGTAATIPRGWTRDTAFDDRFLQGQTAGNDPATNGGAATHSHTSSHTHTVNAHGHSIAATSPSSGSTLAAKVQSPPSQQPTVSGLGSPGHTHSAFDSAFTTISITSKSLTTTAVAMQPPFVRHIIIKPSASADIPPNSVVFLDSSTIPPGFNLCDGTAGTINMDGNYILGAAVSGDGGGTGGAVTHTHSFNPHSHLTATHVHSAVTSSGASVSDDPVLETSFSPGEVAPYQHHRVDLQDESSNASTESIIIDSVVSDPVYTQLFSIENTSTIEQTPDGVIVPYVGTVASISTLDYGWLLCDGTSGTYDLRANQIRCTTSAGNIGLTGGSNSHSHTSQSHSHIFDAHNHIPTIVNIDNNLQVTNGGASLPLVQTGHAHTTWTVSTQTPTSQSTSVTTSSVDARYLYRTVLFLKLPTNKVTVNIEGANIKGANIL